MTDVNTMPFDPWPPSEVHVEHGLAATRLAAERGDIIVVIDVLSFSTTLSIAIELGATVLALSAAQIQDLGGRDAVAKEFRAHVVAKDRDDAEAKFTLSPASLAKVSPDDRLVLTSLNGAGIVAAAGTATVLVGSIRSASVTARVIDDLMRKQGPGRVTLIAATEQWSSTALGQPGFRFAIEDLIGAGVIAGALGDQGKTLSIEAEIAAEIATAHSSRIEETLSQCVSGRELIERGFESDIANAAQLDAATETAVRGDDGFFQRTRPHQRR